MSLIGKATAGKGLRGKINGLETIRGYSAYEIALICGFEGTEEEWLASLKGEQGKPGYTPVRGVDYWTEADIAAIKSYVDSLASGTILPATIEG